MPELNTQPFSIGTDCVFKYSLDGADATEASIPSKILRIVDVSWSDGFDAADVTDRGSGGMKNEATTLRTLSLSANLIYDPTENNFNELYTAYGERKRIVIGIGDDRGNYFVWCGQIFKFDIDQSLTSAMTASIEIRPTRAKFKPTWIKSEE